MIELEELTYAELIRLLSIINNEETLYNLIKEELFSRTNELKKVKIIKR